MVQPFRQSCCQTHILVENAFDATVTEKTYTEVSCSKCITLGALAIEQLIVLLDSIEHTEGAQTS
jgi:hypothetical protein